MKFAMRDSRTREHLDCDSGLKWTFIAFFFHDRGKLIQKSIAGMLQEIVDSIVRQLPRLAEHAVTQYKQLTNLQRTKRPKWTLESLAAIIASILEQRDVRLRLLLFLDALDEHEGDNEELLRLIRDWGQRADGRFVNLKICIASRPWNVFRQNFSHGPNFAIDRYTTNDIRVYTFSRLTVAQDRGKSRLSAEMLESLVTQITEKAQGVFIWVRLVTDQLTKDLRDGTPFKTLIRRIADMPEELEDLYDKILVRIDQAYAKESSVMFQMVLCAFESLPLTTLAKATEFSVDKFTNVRPLEVSDNLDDETSSYFLQWLMSRSGGLLETYCYSSDNPATWDRYDCAGSDSELPSATYHGDKDGDLAQERSVVHAKSDSDLSKREYSPADHVSLQLAARTGRKAASRRIRFDRSVYYV